VKKIQREYNILVQLPHRLSALYVQNATCAAPALHVAQVFFGYQGGGADSHRLATHSAIRRTRLPGAPRQSLTRKIRLTPLSQAVPSARTKIAWCGACWLRLPQPSLSPSGCSSDLDGR
jgi:hypothetical protein